MTEFERGLVVAIGHHFCGAGSGPEIDALGQSMAEEIAKDAAAYIRAHLLSEATLGRVRDAMDLAFVREEDEARAALAAVME